MANSSFFVLKVYIRHFEKSLSSEPTEVDAIRFVKRENGSVSVEVEVTSVSYFKHMLCKYRT